MKTQVANAIPTYFVRYEDLVLNAEPVLTELFCFLLDVHSIEGTVVQERIRTQVIKGTTKNSAFKLKADPTQNLSRNEWMYSEEQIEYMKEACCDYLYFFNYVDGEQADPNTTFFHYNR